MYRQTGLCPFCSAFSSETCNAYKYRRPGSTPKNNGIAVAYFLAEFSQRFYCWYGSSLHARSEVVTEYFNNAGQRCIVFAILGTNGELGCSAVGVESLKMVLSRAIGGSWLQVDRYQGSMTRHNFAHLMCNKVSPRRPGTSLYMQHSHQVYSADTCSSDRL